ncbi:MAG: chaperone NapD [Alphaproteobacteria bacterium]|uniref:Chaperone NapD n=1 Tax=Candidatus Nitrobium versatile TaxID=2884831 RepID=A0A953M2R2_9BACT|nr:chaperone NapD [Candidatus Nitrobium versatile]
MVGFIVRVEENAREFLSASLSRKPHMSVHGAKGDQILLLLDTDDIHVIAQSTREINEMKGVVGVYPIFSPDSLPF